MTKPNATHEQTLQRLSAEIGRRRREGLPCEDLIAQHRELSAQLRAAQARSESAPRQLVIECVTDIESAGLRDIWSDLLTASNAFSPSMSWEWAYAWYKHFGKGKAVEIRVVKESRSGQVVGLLPLMEVSPWHVLLRHEGYLPCRQLAPLGTRMGVEIDYTHPLVDANCHREQVVHLLVQSLSQSAKPFVANHWDSGNDSAELLITQARDLGFLTITFPRSIAYDSLPDSFEEFVEQVPKTMVRRKLRKYQPERVLENGRFTLKTHLTAQEIISRFPIIQRFSVMKYGFASIWKLPWFVEFMASCVDLCAPQGWPVLWMLHESEEPVAVVFGWLYNKAFFLTALAHDAKRRDQEPGHMLLAQVISQLIERRIRWFDMHTAEGYKTYYLRQRRIRYDPLILCPPGHSPYLALAGMFGVRAMREAMRTSILKIVAGRRRAGMQPEMVGEN
ncbi:MAG: GNAT family N-acetyltransferase [Candidatus Zipacnadales bacterium]